MKMIFRIAALAVLSLALGTSSAYALNASIGGPDDVAFGCDAPGACVISLDENGHISATFTGTVFGISSLSAYPIAPTVNPLWVDGLGNPLQVLSYRVDSVNGISIPLGLIPGALGLCEFGVNEDGSACTGNGDDKSDVLIFTNLGGGNNRIDFLSDNEAFFPFSTDFNILEIGPEGTNGATYTNVPCNDCNVENITYQIISDVPEPATLTLLGLGLAGLGFSRRRRAS
jgi:hypothetical protein